MIALQELEASCAQLRAAAVDAIRDASTAAEVLAVRRLCGGVLSLDELHDAEIRCRELTVLELSAPLEMPRGALLRDEVRDAMSAAATEA